jgi:hypothetical protein
LTLLALSVAAAQPLHAASYALLFSGGGDYNNNMDRFYDETSRMWSLTTGTLGYDVDNVYVLFADGTNPYVDQLSYKVRDWITSDWSQVTTAGGHIAEATRANFISTVQEIGSRMVSGQDTFYMWTFDHGGQQGSAGQGWLTCWDLNPVLGLPAADAASERIYTSEFASLLDPITSKNPVWEAYAMAQCFAEDFRYGLNITESDTDRFFAWAAEYYQYSYDHSWADAWADGIEAGNTNSIVLGEYAVQNDIYGQHQGFHLETPGYTGGSFSIAAIPEAATWLYAAALGLPVLFHRRRRK